MNSTRMSSLNSTNLVVTTTGMLFADSSAIAAPFDPSARIKAARPDQLCISRHWRFGTSNRGIVQKHDGH